jgi:hypothetical protein
MYLSHQNIPHQKGSIKDGGTVRAYHGSNAVFDEFKKEKIEQIFQTPKMDSSSA